ncbi:MAG: hypothetical protein ACRENJ_12205 [Candidatus Eiseniibacteriota bacterium]
MRPSRHSFHAGAIATAVLLALAAMTPPADAADAFGTNLRAFFAVGPSYPIQSEDVRPGFGMAFGLEAEQWSRSSVLFRIEWNRMSREYPAFPWYIPPQEVNVVNWSLGARAHLRPHRAFRPYGEICLGVRLEDASGAPVGIIPFREATPGSSDPGEGLAVTLRLGLSGQGGTRAGFFLDSGVDLLAGHPDRFGLVPVRLGVVFP